MLITPSPIDRGTGYCFRSISLYDCIFVSLFVSLLARLRENGWTDLHEIFRVGMEWPWDHLITFLVNSEKLCDAAMRNTGTGFVVLLHHSLLIFCYFFCVLPRAVDVSWALTFIVRCGCVLCMGVCVCVCNLYGLLPDSYKDWLIDACIVVSCHQTHTHKHINRSLAAANINTQFYLMM